MTERAIIADDELNLAQELAEELNRLWPELEICGIAQNGVEALEMIEGLKPRIAFLDIKMPGLSGLEVFQQLIHPCHVVFVTAYDQYAVEAFEQQAVDYLLKPITEKRLEKCIERLKQSITIPPSLTEMSQLLAKLNERLQPIKTEYLDWVKASVGNNVRMIPVEEICYFQASEKYTLATITEGEFLLRITIKDLLQQLDPRYFWQTHRSTIVNVRKIEAAARSITGKMILKIKGKTETLPVSQPFEHLFRQM